MGDNTFKTVQDLRFEPLYDDEDVAAAKTWLQKRRDEFKGTTNFNIFGHTKDGSKDDYKNIAATIS